MIVRAGFAGVLLTLVFVFTLASFHPLDFALGAAAAAGILVVFRRFLLTGDGPAAAGLAIRILWSVPLAAAVVRDIVAGTWQVALVVLHARPLRSPGIVEVPFEERTPQGVVATSIAATLSPGEFLVDIDWERRVMLVHVLDAADHDEVRERHSHFYRRWQRRVFP